MGMEDGYGLKMSGTPFGDTLFVAYHLEEKLGKAVSETEKVKRLLHTSPMALATQLIFCEQGLLQFEMQLLDPTVLVPYLVRCYFDRDAQHGSRNQISGACVASTKKNSSTSSASGFWST